MHIVILDAETLQLTDEHYQQLNQLGTYELYGRTQSHEVIERAQHAQAIITNKVPITAQHLQQLPQLRYIGITATGVDNIDVAAADYHNVTVKNVPTYSTQSVAQLTIGLLINIAHQINHHSQAVKHGDWANQPHFSFWERPLIELAGLNLGLVGFGAIAQQVAAIGYAMGLNIQVYNRSPEKVLPPYQAVNWDELLQYNDIISLHCPLTDSTKQCINEHSLAQLKQGAILLNTARGGLIDEDALYQALTQGPLYAAGLDVMSQEPPKPDNPLLMLDNCFITPHIGWATLEARERVWQQTVNNLWAFQREHIQSN